MSQMDEMLKEMSDKELLSRYKMGLKSVLSGNPLPIATSIVYAQVGGELTKRGYDLDELKETVKDNSRVE